MAECQMITHEIEKGDTLYRLARMYHTTVPMILLANPGINPYNLQIGTKIKICQGKQMVERPSMDEIQMTQDFSHTLMQYTEWLKLYLLSLMQPASRQRDVAVRVQQAANEIVDIFALFYPAATVTKLNDLFARQYTQAVMSYANAQNNADTMAAKEFKDRIEELAEELAKLLSALNRYYNEEYIKEWLLAVPMVAERVVAAMKNNDTMEEFEAYDDFYQWAKKGAAYLAGGLRREFYKEG